MDQTLRPKLSIRDFFLQLGALVLLYVSAGTLLSLLFTVIDVAFPRVDVTYYYQPSISWPVAVLIVIVPLYVALSWFLQRQFTADPSKRESLPRRVLVYLTLFASGAVIVGDLITVLYYYLDGQIITTGFLLKVLVVLIVAKLIFWYYILDLRSTLTKTLETVFIAVALIILIVSIVFGFSVTGSPRTQRLLRYDQQKVTDLIMIQNQIINEWTLKGRVPTMLAELNDQLSGYKVPQDPQTAASYEYQKTGDMSFKLCANFNLNSKQIATDRSSTYPYGYGSENDNWQHSAGGVCFTRTIDPLRYPVRK